MEKVFSNTSVISLISVFPPGLPAAPSPPAGCNRERKDYRAAAVGYPESTRLENQEAIKVPVNAAQKKQDLGAVPCREWLVRRSEQGA